MRKAVRIIVLILQQADHQAVSNFLVPCSKRCLALTRMPIYRDFSFCVLSHWSPNFNKLFFVHLETNTLSLSTYWSGQSFFKGGVVHVLFDQFIRRPDPLCCRVDL